MRVPWSQDLINEFRQATCNLADPGAGLHFKFIHIDQHLLELGLFL